MAQGYGEEYKALKEMRRVDLSLQRQHCSATAQRNVNLVYVIHIKELYKRDDILQKRPIFSLLQHSAT